MFPSVVQNATKTLRLTSSPALGGPVTRTTSTIALQRSQALNLSDLEPTARSPALATRRRWTHSHHPHTKWRPVQVLDEWVSREARPISLRQLMVFGRSLTESRLISSANYVRTELPTRIAHRLRDMQRLPYVVVSNPHIRDVYELYYDAFDQFRRVREVKTLDDNERFCAQLAATLRRHLTVIPKLTMGMLECSGLMPADDLDRFMNTLLRSRISRRVIAEQHLALTETFHADWFQPGAPLSESEFIGQIFLKCVAKDVIERCGQAVRDLARSANGPGVQIPEIKVEGHLDATFPYILSHLEYIVGELLRNSVRAVIDHHSRSRSRNDSGAHTPPPPPVEVTVCEAQRHVIIRISDRGGGIPRDVLPHLWSFAKTSSASSSSSSGGPFTRGSGSSSGKGNELRSEQLENLVRVPLMAATLQELRVGDGNFTGLQDGKAGAPSSALSSSSSSSSSPPTSSSALTRAGAGAGGPDSSLSHLSSRPPDLRLGMGLPLSRVYAEYWAGGLELHSLEGYGVDAFLTISKLGNKNERLATRAAMDAV